MITALGKYTVQNMIDKFRWGNLSEDQKISILNSAQEELATFVNTRTSRTDYQYDIIGDGDDVLSPTSLISVFTNLYSAYCKVKFSAYTGDDAAISYVSATKILIYPDTNNLVTNTDDDNYIVYTIPFLGATIDLTYEVSNPAILIDKSISGGSLIITALKNHAAFDIEIKKTKES